MREERLRATAHSIDGLGLSSWRGRSGRRIVVAVHAFATVDPADLDDAVVLAVARDERGDEREDGGGEADAPRARILGVTTADALPDAALRSAWLARAARRGACEIHLHRLAETPQARAALARDLGGAPRPAGLARSQDGAGASREAGARRRRGLRRGAADALVDASAGGATGKGGTGRRPARR